MGKIKTVGEKVRNRKSVNLNGSAKSSSPPVVGKNVTSTSSEKLRFRKSHRKSHSFSFGSHIPKLYRRLGIGVSIFMTVGILLKFGIHHFQTAQKQRQISTPINLPWIIGPNETGPDISPELFWGTYRPNVFFGISHRSPHSMLFGLAWVAFDGKAIQIRHQCISSGEILSYNWIEHDGRNYGIQTIISGNHNITVAFVKRPSIPNGGDWSARISVSSVDKTIITRPISLIFYAYLPDSTRGRIQSFANGRALKRLRGFTQELGAFQVNFHTAQSGVPESTHLAGHCPREDAIVAAISSGLALREGHLSVHFTGEQQEDLLYDNQRQVPSFAGRQTNFWATEITRPAVPANYSGDQTPPNIMLEVEFVSQASTSSDAIALTGAHFDEALARHSRRFHEVFDQKFPHDPSVVSEEQIALSKISLSNLLGGIGYFYGTSLVTSPVSATSPSTAKSSTGDSAPSLVLEYWPTALFTATPSRSQFPRGFLWDEGFHSLLIARWDVELALQSLGHWLDLLNAEGWIPREQILGWEARAAVPPKFIIQSTAVANPPALILAIEDLLARRATQFSKDEAELFDRWARLAFPRLHAWFVWFTNTQSGEMPTAFRWRGRPENNPHQLNPLTLASGLDDYPRASHPTNSERHLDLRCWLAAFARTLAHLAEHFQGLSATSPNVKEYRDLATKLLDPQRLDELHWDEANGIYADFGLHSDAVSLVRPIVQRAPIPGEAPPQRERRVYKDPQEGFISSSVGYVNFFPLLLRLLPPTSPRLPILIRRLADPEVLFSPYGLRSLAPSSPLYQRSNTDHDPPYWRGAIWMNVNYLAIEALRYYAQHPETPPPVSEEAANLQKRLSSAVLNTVLNEYTRTGHTWERYDDRTGAGLSGHPFNGWTALVSLIASEEGKVTK